MMFRCLCSGSQANHGGGYQYRLCPKGQPLTEVLETFMFNTFLMAYRHILSSCHKLTASISPSQSSRSVLTLSTLKECFQKMPLPFVGLQAFHWGDGVKVFSYKLIIMMILLTILL